MEGMKTLALAASLLLSGGCPERDLKSFDCRSSVTWDIVACLKGNVTGVYDGVCTREGAEKLSKVAEKECMPEGVSSQFFPDSKACQWSIRAAVNNLCEEVHEDDRGLL